MIYTKDEISERIIPIAEKYNLAAIYLFGSYARSEATEESDIDLLIDRQGSDIKGLRYFGLFDEFAEILDKHVDLVSQGALDQQEDRERPYRKIFREALERDKVLIYERAR